MKTTNFKTRRQFLKNSAIAAATLSILPKFSVGKTSGSDNFDDCAVITLDYYGEGPFYTENPPLIENSQLAEIDEPGQRIILSGRVMNLDCTEALPNTLIDIWHANAEGNYDNEGFNLRGQTFSNEQGFYMIETIYPGNYGTRPAHFHLKITPPDQETIVTQLYFKGDPYLESDTASSIDSGEFDATNRIITLTENTDGKLEGTWDIIINSNGVGLGVNELHLQNGMIYKAFPNPISDKLTIEYGIFKDSLVNISVFNIQGQEVAFLRNEQLLTEKYKAEWIPDSNLPNGTYFVSLKVNGIQVHHQKVILKR